MTLQPFKLRRAIAFQHVAAKAQRAGDAQAALRYQDIAARLAYEVRLEDLEKFA